MQHTNTENYIMISISFTAKHDNEKWYFFSQHKKIEERKRLREEIWRKRLLFKETEQNSNKNNLPELRKESATMLFVEATRSPAQNVYNKLIYKTKKSTENTPKIHRKKATATAPHKRNNLLSYNSIFIYIIFFFVLRIFGRTGQKEINYYYVLFVFSFSFKANQI